MLSLLLNPVVYRERRVVRRNASGGVEFEGQLLQNVREGQEGFATRLKVGQSAGGGEGGARVGDTVTLAYSAVLEEGGGGGAVALESGGEELTFQVGAGDVVGNPLFTSFDLAVRGLREGDKAEVQAEGGAYDKELLFAVPRGHSEVARLEAEAAAAGGLREGSLVVLSNGKAAVVRRVDDEAVVLDCNHPLAGAPLRFTLLLTKLERAETDVRVVGR